MPAQRVVGRAGQGYTGLGAMGRAQGAQSRWLPQTQTAMGRVGQRAAAGAAGMREDWMRLWGRVAERKRAEEIAALGDVGRALGLGIGKWKARRTDALRPSRLAEIPEYPGPEPSVVSAAPPPWYNMPTEDIEALLRSIEARGFGEFAGGYPR